MFGIKKELQKAVYRLGIGQEVEAFTVCKYSEEVFKHLLNVGFSSPKVIKYLKSTQTIEVEINNFFCTQELRSKKNIILKQINQKLGGSYVKKIRYRME